MRDDHEVFDAGSHSGAEVDRVSSVLSSRDETSSSDSAASSNHETARGENRSIARPATDVST